MEKLSPDVLVLDIEMPGLSGVEVARRLCESGSLVHILVLSAHDDINFVKELLANGVDGYIIKEDAPKSLIDAVHGVARGEQGWVSRRIVAQMLSSFREVREIRENSKDLTEREIQVLEAAIEGLTNLEIGLALKISEKTVEKHMGRIFIKLGVASRAEAAVHAVRKGLVGT